MKIAITAQHDNLNALVDPRFGRCAFFAIHDTQTGNTSFITNPNRATTSGAGPASVSLLAKHKVNKIVAGEFGTKIKSLLDELNIQMIAMKEEKTIQDIINLIK